MDRTIKVVCYDRIESWHCRKAAIAFFRECAMGSEGAERDRYLNVLWDLEAKIRPAAHDGSSIPYWEAVEKGLFYVTDAPDGSRDYGGEIWYAR